MAITSKDDNSAFEILLKELDSHKSDTIDVGVIGKGQDNLMMIAGVHEFGATIKPKNVKYLPIPLTRQAKNTRPREMQGLFFWINKKTGKKFLVKNVGGKIELQYWLADRVTIPQRSFIRSTFDEYGEMLHKYGMKSVEKAVLGEIVFEQAINSVGSYGASLVRKKFRNLHPALSPITVATRRNGSNMPLQDTGRLKRSIGFEVNGKLGKGE